MRKTSTIRIGCVLKEIRKSYGYTQEKLAEKVEVSPRYIGDIEQDRAKPSYEVLVKFCNLFNIGLDQITGKHILAGNKKLNKEDKNTIDYLITFFNSK